MKAQAITLMLIVGMILLTACAGGNSAVGAELEGATWVLVELNGETPREGSRATLQFEGEQLSGNAGCNHYGGNYRTQGNTIQVDNLFATEMACLEPEGILKQEQAYLTALGMANRFEVNEGELTLLVDQQPLLRLSKE